MDRIPPGGVASQRRLLLIHKARLLQRRQKHVGRAIFASCDQTAGSSDCLVPPASRRSNTNRINAGRWAGHPRRAMRRRVGGSLHTPRAAPSRAHHLRRSVRRANFNVAAASRICLHWFVSLPQPTAYTVKQPRSRCAGVTRLVSVRCIPNGGSKRVHFARYSDENSRVFVIFGARIYIILGIFAVGPVQIKRVERLVHPPSVLLALKLLQSQQQQLVGDHSWPVRCDLFVTVKRRT